MAMNVFQYINMMIERENRKEAVLSYEEWCDIRRNGTPEEIEEAVERMMDQGGYDCLE